MYLHWHSCVTIQLLKDKLIYKACRLQRAFCWSMYFSHCHFFPSNSFLWQWFLTCLDNTALPARAEEFFLDYNMGGRRGEYLFVYLYVFAACNILL